MTPGEVFRARIIFRRDQVEAAKLYEERTALTRSLRLAMAVYAVAGVYLVLALLGIAPVPLV